MCVDFTDLNKCCPKDPYPLPRIDKLVDIAAGCKMMSLLDCFFDYHQIWMNLEDKEKTSFITPGGTYCYRRMPEGLRNVGPTFSRMTNEVFNEQKGKISWLMLTTKATRKKVTVTTWVFEHPKI